MDHHAVWQKEAATNGSDPKRQLAQPRANGQ
jgi:hypothetical protein